MRRKCLRVMSSGARGREARRQEAGGSSKTVHALTATLVQVANPISSPVPTADVARSVSENVELVCSVGLNVPNNLCVQVTTQPECFPLQNLGIQQCSQYTVPPGQNLVVDTVEAAQNAASVVQIGLHANNPFIIVPTPLDSYGVPGGNVTTQYQYPVAGLVIGPGLQPEMILHNIAPNASGDLVLVGHLRPN